MRNSKVIVCVHLCRRRTFHAAGARGHFHGRHSMVSHVSISTVNRVKLTGLNPINSIGNHPMNWIQPVWSTSILSICVDDNKMSLPSSDKSWLSVAHIVRLLNYITVCSNDNNEITVYLEEASWITKQSLLCSLNFMWVCLLLRQNHVVVRQCQKYRIPATRLIYIPCSPDLCEREVECVLSH